MKTRRRQKRNQQTPAMISGLPVRQLRWLGAVALALATIAVAALNWERWFPTPPEQLVEVVWTHECPCAAGWILALREHGFVVRDHEIFELSSARRHWRVPEVASGCHPGRFMGYVLDGHVPGALLRRLARERPHAVAVLQARTPDPQDMKFELLEQDGTRRAWP